MLAGLVVLASPAGHGQSASLLPPRCSGRRGAAAARGAVRVAAEQGPGQGPRVKTVQHHPDRLLIRRPVPAGDRVPRSAQPGQVCLAGPPDPLPDCGEPVVPRSGERADRDRDQAGQRVDPPLR